MRSVYQLLTAMKYTFPYNFAGSIEIPDRNLVGIYKAQFPHSTTPESEVIAQAIQNPIGAPRPREMVKPGE